jgi:hypothetical protein
MKIDLFKIPEAQIEELADAVREAHTKVRTKTMAELQREGRRARTEQEVLYKIDGSEIIPDPLFIQMMFFRCFPQKSDFGKT